MSSLYCSTCTEGNTATYSLTWTLTNFSLLLQCKSQKEIRTEKISTLQIQMKMQLLGHNNDVIEIYYLTPMPVFLKVVLSAPMSCDFIQDYRAVQGNKWQYLETFYKRDIFKIILSNLILKLDFIVATDHNIDRSITAEPQLCNDFENLLNSNEFSDVIMKSIEGVEYKVHKAVLACRSAVLKAHFEHDTTECQTNVLESPLESDVLQKVLIFIYCDKAPTIDEMPEKLLLAADYYQLSRLKTLCENALYKKLTVDNAIEMLKLADLHSANTLKQSTLEYIKDGQAYLITKTKSWASIESVDLIKMIYEFIANDEVDTVLK